MKTYQAWQLSGLGLHQFLQPGDVPDADLVEHIRCTLPPACDDGSVLQLGEASRHVGFRPVYLTLVRHYPIQNVGVWVYVGDAYRGERSAAPAHTGEDRQVAVWLVREEYETLINALERGVELNELARQTAREQRMELAENMAFSAASAKRALIAKLSHYHAQAKPRQS